MFNRGPICGVSLPYEWEWPDGVPRTNEELLRDHGSFIVRRVRRYNHSRYEHNLEDLHQAIFEKLLNSRVFEKFVESSARKLPLTITVAEMLAYLGLTQREWYRLLYRRDWLPTPLAGGSAYDLDAIYSMADVHDIDETFAKVRRGRRVRPVLSAKGFRSYLDRAIHNHFANFCRYEDRHHKEQPLDQQVMLSQQSDGCYYQSFRSDEVSSSCCWESTLTSAMVYDEETRIDLCRVLRSVPFELNSSEGTRMLDFFIQQGRTSDGPQRNMDVLEMIGQGCTLTEAIKEVRCREAGIEPLRVMVLG